MKQRRVGFMTREFPGVTPVRLQEKTSLLEFDVVILDLALLLMEYAPQQQKDGSLLSNPEMGSICRRDVLRRRIEIGELLQKGGAIAVLAAPPHQLEMRFSQQEAASLSSLVPLTPFAPEPAEGESIELRHLDVFRPLLEQNRGEWRYTAFLPKPPGSPFLFVTGTSRALATYQKVSEGHVLILPALRFSRQLEAGPKFLASLLETLDVLEGSDDEPAPAWAQSFHTTEEQLATARASKVRREIEERTQELAEVERDLAEESRLKVLLYGSGKPLEREVLRALRALGIEARDGPPGRTDILLKFDGQSGVAEVKGKKSSAGERDARQLEAWVSEHEGSDVPKALLIINAFNDLPPQDRKEPAFPHQMLAYSLRRQHALVTTSQLFALLLQARRSPEKRDELARSLWTCEGIFSGYEDISQFLTIDEDNGSTPRP